MDLYSMFASPVEAVFGYVADPSRLSDWLAEVTSVSADPVSPDGIGTEFSLTVQADTATVAASGEMTAFEPPWLVAYRVFAGPRTHGLRVTCTAQAGGTRIHVHQPEEAAPLTIDLSRLSRALATASPPPQPPGPAQH